MTGTSRGPRPAIFFDRDGTLIEDEHYLADPARVRLVAAAADAIRALRDAGYAIVVVTNQSGIARGSISVEQYSAVEHALDAMLAAAGAPVDATYICPHHPDITGPCTCRKPNTGLFTRAAAELDLDLSRSYAIGDRWRDVEPAITLGAHGILVPAETTPPTELTRRHERVVMAHGLADAAALVVKRSPGRTAALPHLTAPARER